VDSSIESHACSRETSAITNSGRDADESIDAITSADWGEGVDGDGDVDSASIGRPVRRRSGSGSSQGVELRDMHESISHWFIYVANEADPASAAVWRSAPFGGYKRSRAETSGMNVQDAMTPRSELVVVELPGSRDDVLEYLQEYGFSSVPVIKHVDGEEVYRGLVSRDDLIEQPNEDQLALLMREVPVTDVDADIATAAATMVETGSRRLPVVDGDELVGICTVTDAIRAIARGEVNGEEPVSELATRTVNSTHVETPLPVAEREIGLAGVPYAVVLDDDASMAGMLTEVDVLEVARVVEGEASTGDSIAEQDSEWSWEGIKATGARYLPTRNVEIPSEPVYHFMTSEVVTVSGSRSAKAVAKELLSNDIEQVPLVSGTELQGVVRDIDLLEGI